MNCLATTLLLYYRSIAAYFSNEGEFKNQSCYITLDNWGIGNAKRVEKIT